MLNLNAAATRLGREVPEAESSIDDALINVMKIAQTSILARRDNPIPGGSAQSSLIKLHKSMGSLISAQNDILRVHDELANLGRELAVGDEPYCPKKTGSLEEDTNVRKIA